MVMSYIDIIVTIVTVLNHGSTSSILKQENQQVKEKYSVYKKKQKRNACMKRKSVGNRPRITWLTFMVGCYDLGWHNWFLQLRMT